MAYVKHKPQYRNVRTTNVAPIGRPRDIRKRLPDMRGKVVLPDKSGLPRKYPLFNAAARAKPAFGRFAFSQPLPKAGRASFWYRGAAADLGRVAGGLAAVMAAYELYQYVNDLGGDPYRKPGGKMPYRSYGTQPDPLAPGGVLAVPVPVDVPGYGWTYLYSGQWVYGTVTGEKVYSGEDHRVRNFPSAYGFWHIRMPNDSATYSPGAVNANPPPAVTGGGATRTYTWQNRLQDGGRLSYPTVWTNVLNDKWNWAITLPVAHPVPVLGEFIPPFRSPAADAETVRANWPRYADAPALLPYGDLWKPIPWGMVNAVNLVRGHLGIREEGFLEDVGGPRPKPRPEAVHKPVPSRVKEKKGRSNSGRLLLFYRAVRKAWHEADESLEKVDILYDSLPGWVRNRERAKLPHQKIAALLRNWQHIDVSSAVYGLIENEVEDAVIGRGFKSLEDAFEKLGVRGWRGDLAMQYSTDALFDLYGAVKGGL